MVNNKKHNNEVLIVDDEVDICFLLSGMLKKKNFHTACVTSLLAAENAMDRINPFIIFIDNHLPDGFGVDFIPHIKKEYPNTKVIMITAHDNMADRDKAFLNGVDFFIGKPFTGDIINLTVDAAINS